MKTDTSWENSRDVSVFVKRKPPAVLVVPKSFSYARFMYPSKARNQVGGSKGKSASKPSLVREGKRSEPHRRRWGNYRKW